MGVVRNLQSGQATPSSGGVLARLRQQDQANQHTLDVEQSDMAQMAKASRVAAERTATDSAKSTPIVDLNTSPIIQKVQQYATENPAQELPGRDIPVLGPVLRTLDKVGSAVERSGVGPLMRSFIVPGASAANVGVLTGAAERTLGLGAARVAQSPAVEQFLINNGIHNPGLVGNVVKGIATEAAVGAPLGAAQYLSNGGNDLGEAAKQGLYGAAFGGALGAAGPVLGKGLEKFAGSKVGESLARLLGRTKTPQEEKVAEILGLPAAGEAYVSPEEMAFNQKRARSQSPDVIPSGSPIPASGDIAPSLALPEGNYIRPQRLKVSSDPEKLLANALERIKPEVDAAITPPKRRDLLIEYIQKHLDVPKEEVWNMPMQDLEELGQHIRQGINVHDVAVKTAAKHGYDLPALLEGKATSLDSKIATDAQKRIYGVFPERTPIKQPEGFNVSVTGQVAAPRESGFQVKGRAPNDRVKLDSTFPRQERVLAGSQQTVARPVIEGAQVPARQTGQRTPNPSASNEYGFVDTVKNSPMTSDAVKERLVDPGVVGRRTTNAADMERADKIIEKKGIHGATQELLSARKIGSVENVLAQKLMRHYQNIGDVETFLNILNKTAKDSRFMGQAIQALSLWNKLDADGAMLLANKAVNRGKTLEEAVDVTAEQAKPILAATEKIQKVEQAKNLAEEVQDIVSKKTNGEQFTESELATIKEFQKQLNDINTKIKTFLPDKETRARKVVSEINKVEPEKRTREQIIDYWTAREELAKKKLAKQRNVGLLPNTENPVLLYAEIGVSKLVKGTVRSVDFAQAMIRDYGEQVKPIINQVYDKAVNLFRKSQGLPTTSELNNVINTAIKNNALDKETAAKFSSWAKEIAFYTDDNLRTEAVQDLQLALKQLGRSTLGEKVSTIQSANMLLNLATIGRNVLGNGQQFVIEKLNKMAAVPIDWMFSKFTGERTIKFLPHNQEKMWKNTMIGVKSGWKGVSPTGTLDSYDIHPDVFGNKNPLRYLTKTLGATLQGMDYPAYKAAYGDVLATYGEQLGLSRGLNKAQIKEQMPELIKQLDNRIYELADKAGLYATYQDETLLSIGAQSIKKGLNKITDVPMKMLTEKGLLPESVSMRGFGLGDVVLKFTKTPANIIMRGIDYSPIGFLRGVMELAPLAFNRSKFNQFEATRALSRAITGTLGLTAVGYALADAGILTGAASADKDMRSLHEQSGNGAYKVNWSALERYLQSGFDKNAAKPQTGDRMFDYAWLQPAAIPLSMGVNANEAWKRKKLGEETTTVKQAEIAILGGLRSVLENPMVTGVSNVVDATTDLIKRQSADKFGQLVKGVPASFVPSLLNQQRTSVDNLQRETYDKNILNEMMNLVKNKIPGLSKTLPVSYNSLGQPSERIQGGEANTLGQYLTSFLSPAKSTEYAVSADAKIVLDVLNDSKDSGVLPRVVDRYIMVDDPVTKKQKKVDLTAEQFSRLQQVVGQNTMIELKKKEKNLTDPNKSAEDKAKMIKDILSTVGARAKNEVRAEMGYKKKQVR